MDSVINGLKDFLDNSPSMYHAVAYLEKELAEVKESAAAMRSAWDAEKNAIVNLRTLRESLDTAKLSLDKAEREQDLERAGELRFGIIPGIQKQIEEAEQKLHEEEDGKKLLKEEVSEEDIAQIVSTWTRIPVSRLVP